MKPTLSRQAIFNVFEGKATPLQKTLVEEWLVEPEHQELYFQWLEEWERENQQFFPNTENAYAVSLRNRHSPGLSDPGGNEETELRIRYHRWRFYWLTAASVLLLTAAGAFFMKDWLLYKKYVTAAGEVRSFILADSSRVTLNASTILKVRRFDLGQGPREVWLTGEAEFSVKHTLDNRPFFVRTPDELEVKVLGTEFIVYSRNNGSKIALNTGKVQIRSLKNQHIAPLIIAPGDVVTVSKPGRLSLKHNQPVSALAAWKQHHFMFENTPVSEIASRLEEQFGVRVIIMDSTLARRTLGGTFKAGTIEELLPVLSQMLNLDIKRSDGPPATYELTSSVD